MAWEALRSITELWPTLGTALTSLADGADLLLTDTSELGLAANVAGYYDIPVAALHYYPSGGDSQVTKDAAYAQRRELGLPELPAPTTRQALELQPTTNSSFLGWRPHGRNATSDGLSLAR